MTGFGARLASAMAERGPLCLGIDPHPELLRAWGLTVDVAGLSAFCDVCVQAYEGFAIVKPQVAFFESYGAAGYSVLETVIAELRDAGVLVLADAKRGDIGSTMAAYAAAWAGTRLWPAMPSRRRPISASNRCVRCSTPPPSMAEGCSSLPRHPTQRVRACSEPPSTGAPSPSRSSTT